MIACDTDEVIIKIKSPGGSVMTYGLAASILESIKQKDIRLTVLIDEVAASGDYLMALVADKIVAAPFSIVGSIGVVSQYVNFSSWLDKKDIKVDELTAGEKKNYDDAYLIQMRTDLVHQKNSRKFIVGLPLCLSVPSQYRCESSS